VLAVRTEVPLVPGSNGYTIFENTDAGLYPDDNDQAVIMIAPTVLLPLPNFVAMLDNTVTSNSTNYLLQQGLGRSYFKIAC
jgi:hypothetical protein